ncbi:hypothetical protein MSAN_02249200 [Mycena sanguinolenta]|uniref:Uncharacterized protein n=1 Tax=Mycena sanguinolenta TaxID=230812 RepID=A0A8H6XBM4_9AGAR|nr:hypothetical protein MSAN_02249200 [Mycena sanguinolenta]
MLKARVLYFHLRTFDLSCHQLEVPRGVNPLRMLAEELLLHIISFLTRLPGDYNLVEGISQTQELIRTCLASTPRLKRIPFYTARSTGLFMNSAPVSSPSMLLRFSSQSNITSEAHSKNASLLESVLILNVFSDARAVGAAFSTFLRPWASYDREIVVHVWRGHASESSRSLPEQWDTLRFRDTQLAHRRRPTPCPIARPGSDIHPNVSPSISVRFETQEQYLGHALMDAIDTEKLDISKYLFRGAQTLTSLSVSAFRTLPYPQRISGWYSPWSSLALPRCPRFPESKPLRVHPPSEQN